MSELIKQIDDLMKPSISGDDMYSVGCNSAIKNQPELNQASLSVKGVDVLRELISNIKIGDRYFDEKYNEHVLHGILVTDEDFYYALENIKSRIPVFVSCVCSLEKGGFFKGTENATSDTLPPSSSASTQDVASSTEVDRLRDVINKHLLTTENGRKISIEYSENARK